MRDDFAPKKILAIGIKAFPRTPGRDELYSSNWMLARPGDEYNSSLPDLEKGWIRTDKRSAVFPQGEESMKFNVTIDRDEDGAWIVECPSIPGCISQGTTKEEALENIQDAIYQCLQVRTERGLPLTIETRQVEVAA